MSYFIISGFFAVANGRRVPSTSRTGAAPSLTHLPFIIYDSAVSCTNGDVVPAAIRIYSHPGEPIAPNNTIFFLNAKAAIERNQPLMLDALLMSAVPGSPDDKDYEDAVPDFAAPIVYAIGSVRGSSTTLEDGKSRSTPLRTADFVRDSLRHSSLLCIFDGSPRWANSPSPSSGSCLGVVGLCDGFLDGQTLRVKMLHMALNVRASDPPTGGPGTPGDGGNGSPGKRRRFVAMAPLAPAAAASPSPSPNKKARRGNARATTAGATVSTLATTLDDLPASVPSTGLIENAQAPMDVDDAKPDIYGDASAVAPSAN